MRTSIATVSLSGTLEAKLQASAAAGFDGVELFEPDLIASTRTPEQVRELAAALGTAPALPVHVSGCERRCGSPAGADVDLVAPRSLDAALALVEAAR